MLAKRLALVACGLLLTLSFVAAPAVATDHVPTQCVDEPDAVDCVVRDAKCMVREGIRFFSDCWGYIGP